MAYVGYEVEVVREGDVAVGRVVDHVVDSRTGLIVERERIAVRVPTEDGGTAIVVEKRIRAVRMPTWIQNNLHSQQQSDRSSQQIQEYEGPFGAPATYEELFPVEEMRDYVREARNDRNPVTILVMLLCKSFLCGGCYIVWGALSITLIIIGSIYAHKCTIQDRIPIDLIILGCVGLLQTAFGILKMSICGENLHEQKERLNWIRLEIFAAGLLFIFVFFFSFSTFSFYDSWVDGGKLSCSSGGASNLCCDAVPMYFSFFFLLLIWGIIAITCFCFCCGVICVRKR